MRLEDRQEPYTGYTIQYIYGVDGIIGFHIGDTYYYYQKNLQGDVVELIRYVPSHDDKQLVATYVYDAWGNHKVLNPDGSENTDSSFIGNKNPIRYRSYYYDVETGLYYLKTRYYDPRTGRFISPDSTKYLETSELGGMNLYAYCGNNPVMYSDPSGNSLILTLVLVGLAAGAAIGFGGTIYSDYKDDGQVFNGSKSVGEYIKNTVIGGVVGAGIGAAVGITAPMMGSFLASSFSIGLPHVVGNTLVATSATVTGAQIAGTAAAVAGLVVFSKHNPGMSNKAPFSWTNKEEGLEAMKKIK